MGTMTALRRLRGRAGLSQRQLAVRAGLNVTTIVKLETGRTTTPQAATIGALAKAFGISFEELWDLLQADEEAAS